MTRASTADARLTWSSQAGEVVGATVGGAISNLVVVAGVWGKARQHHCVQQGRGVVQGGGSAIASHCGVVNLVVCLQHRIILLRQAVAGQMSYVSHVGIALHELLVLASQTISMPCKTHSVQVHVVLYTTAVGDLECDMSTTAYHVACMLP